MGLRNQIGQLKNQVDFLSSVVLKFESDDKNEGSEKGMESDTPLRHENSEIQKNEMLEFRRELNNMKADILRICSGSEANLSLNVPSTEVMELRREIHNLKKIRKNNNVLRHNLNIEGSILNNDRIETVRNPGFLLRQDLNIQEGSIFNNERIESVGRSGLSSLSMVMGDPLTPKRTKGSVYKDL